MDPDSGVILARTADGNALALGLLKCGKIWLCPVCCAKIRHGRAEEITRAVVAWIQRGGTAYLVTFTVRHQHGDRLADLLGALQGSKTAEGKRVPGAYQRLITGGTWAGRKASSGHRAVDRDGIRDRVGYIGMIRATELTRGANGWHPHIHAIVFVGGRTEGERADKHVTGVFTPSESQLAEWQDHFRSVWVRAVKSIDPAFTPDGRKHGVGVDFKPLKTVAEAEGTGQYIAKLQEGKASVSPAHEVARGDLKSGRHGSVTPFQILGRIGDLMGGADPETLPGFGELDQCLAWWAEYEAATKGRRAIEWTRYLRPLLGLDGDDSEETDMDLLFEVDGAVEFRAGVAVEARAWHKVTGRALDLAATEAVEADRLEDVRQLVLDAGGRAGAVRILTPGEITEVWEATLAKLAERRESAAARRRVEAAGTPQE